MSKRAIIIVIDSMGCGAMPDCADFGDTDKCNTLKNVCEFNNGLDLPVMEALGLGNIQNFKGITPTKTPLGQYGILQEKSPIVIEAIERENLKIIDTLTQDNWISYVVTK